jgi:hypothetical protein
MKKPLVKKFGISRRGGRNSALVQFLSPGSKALHFGCADHAPLIQQKLKSGTYLHQSIVDRLGASQTWGYDPTSPAIIEMRRLGFTQVTDCLSDVADNYFDFVLFPDTLEHLQNPGEVLAEIKNLDFDQLIISVPNAYSLSNRFFLSSELINSDHRSLHSPYSLSKLLSEAGFEVQTLAFADYWGWSRPIRSMIKLAFPLTREHLIVVAKKAATTN